MPSASKISTRPYTWAEVRDIIKYNDLNLFARLAEQTEKYLAFKKYLKNHNSTVFRYMLANTLQWVTPQEVMGLSDTQIKVAGSGNPVFTEASDLKIIKNDFPYYFEDDVVHLCVWSKQRIYSDPNCKLGDLSAETRAEIEKYVVQTFVEDLEVCRSDLVWFRNWDALQSVKEISHVHVVVKGMTPDQLEKVLGGPGRPIENRFLNEEN